MNLHDTFTKRCRVQAAFYATLNIGERSIIYCLKGWAELNFPVIQRQKVCELVHYYWLVYSQVKGAIV